MISALFVTSTKPCFGTELTNTHRTHEINRVECKVTDSKCAVITNSPTHSRSAPGLHVRPVYVNIQRFIIQTHQNFQE